MAKLGDVYDDARREISELVRSLDPADLDKTVPATPDWTIKEVVVHLDGVMKAAMRGHFPNEFFESFGEPAAVEKLNVWTADQITESKDATIDDILADWEKNTASVLPYLNDEKPLPEGVPTFVQYVFITDVATHLHDIYGALGIQKNRDDVPVKIAGGSFVTMMDVRMQTAGAPSLLLDAGAKQWTVGGGEPSGTVKAERFEFFRALSGRRSPEQIRAYEWSTDPEPFMTFFYPYGPRDASLEE